MRYGVVTAMALAACGPAVGEARMGVPHPAKPLDCPLEIMGVSPKDMQPGEKFGLGGMYDQIGVVSIGASEGTDPMSESIRQVVRPRACAMGGEVLSLLASGSGANAHGHAQQSISFVVWATHSAQSSKPQKF